MFFSSESNALYNDTAQIHIDLIKRIKNTSANQGSGLVLRQKIDIDDTAHCYSEDFEQSEDTIEKFSDSNEPILHVNEKTLKKISDTLSIKFDADMIQPQSPHTKSIKKNSNIPRELSHTTSDYVNANFFAEPKLNSSEIEKLIRIVIRCFLIAPTTTSFTIGLPSWKQATWWPLIKKYFSVVTHIPAGEKNFVNLSDSKETDDIACKWPVVVVHLSRNTSIQIDNWLIAHCRFNHIGGSSLNK